MNNLALLLMSGGDGVAANGSCAVELYEQEIEEGKGFYVMDKLPSLLKSGGDSVAANPRCAVELDRRAQEGLYQRAQGGLCIHLMTPGIFQADLQLTIMNYR